MLFQNGACSSELLAGLTLTTVATPEGIGDTMIVGAPIVTGPYILLLSFWTLRCLGHPAG